MAVSAAYPGIIGPFVIETDRYEWRKRDAWDLPKQAEQVKDPPFKRIHLYDGGIYDNLGSEPLFDSGKQSAKDGADFIIVSDAGAPLSEIEPGWFRPFRLKRVADIIGEQTRALRIRSFVNFLQNHPHGGAYIQIGTDAKEKLRIRHNAIVSELLLRDSWTSTEDVVRAAGYRTTLRRMTGADFDLLERHGYETAKWNLTLFLTGRGMRAATVTTGDTR
jgi:NTE family protein